MTKFNEEFFLPFTEGVAFMKILSITIFAVLAIKSTLFTSSNTRN